MLHRLRKMFVGVQQGDVAGRARRRLVLTEPHPVVYAVGDVHGCLAELREAEARIADDPVGDDRRKLIVMLGDYVDRGPDSAGVLDHLERPAPGGIERLCLCGNHDDAMMRFVRNPGANLSWLDVGGHATLRSYGIDSQLLLRTNRLGPLRDLVAAKVPGRHVDFLDGLPVSIRVGDVLFVHAGVDPALTLEEQTDVDMMWIREPFLSNGPGFPMTVIHGHTPSVEVSAGPGRIGVDTAAYLTGKLSVLRVHEGEFTVL